MKRIHHRTLGLYSQLWTHQLNALNASRLVGHRLTVVNPLVDTSNKFRNFYCPSAHVFGSQILPSSSVTEATEPEVVAKKSSSKSDKTTNLTSSKTIPEQSSSKYTPDPNAPASDTVDHIGVKIFGANDVESLLSIHGNGTYVSLRNVGHIIFRLGTLVKKSNSPEQEEMERSKIISSDAFTSLCTRLESAQFENEPLALLFCIRGLMNIGVGDENRAYKALENELKWVVRRCPIKLIAKAVAMFTTSDQDIALRKAADTKLNSNHPLIITVYALQRRWVEISTGSEFIAAFQVSSHLTDETRSKLEDRAIELVQEFTPMEIIKIFIALGYQKRRPTPLLRTLAFHLSKSPDRFATKDIIELIYALNALNFAEPVLMARLCNDLHPEIDPISNSALISSLVTSLGQLRYKHTALLITVEDWIMKHLDDLRPFDAAAWLLTCSVLNFKSESDNMDKFCSKAKELLESTKLKNPIGWVNIVHALTVLNQVDASTLATVLEPSLVAKIDNLGENKNLVGVKSKLLNLNGISKTFKDYSGSSLSNEIVTKWSPGVIMASDEKLSASVLESLANFLPPPKYMLTNQKLPFGVFVDAVCKLNAKLDPIPLDSGSVEAFKVAVVVQGYPSLSLGVKEPTGQSQLNIRLLENAGYTVIAVPYTEFHPQEKLLRKVQYLEQCMRNIQTDSTKASSSASQSISSGNISKSQKPGSNR